MVDPAGPWAWARVAPEFWAPPRTIGPQNESPGRAAQNLGPWEPRRSGLGELVDPVRPRTNAQVTRFRWSTLQARGTALETPGTAGQPRLPADQAQVAWERYSTLWHLRHVSESPEMLLATVGPREWA